MDPTAFMINLSEPISKDEIPIQAVFSLYVMFIPIFF